MPSPEDKTVAMMIEILLKITFSHNIFIEAVLSQIEFFWPMLEFLTM